MPMLTPAARKAGVFPGGEGGQWPRDAPAMSDADPNFLLLAIDVGGLYRSLDGGNHWVAATVGWDARGANGFAFDPKNPKRVIGIAGNSMDYQEGWGPSPHGLYLSANQAASWKHVLALREGIGGAVAFDPTSYSAAKKMTLRAYCLSSHSGLFRSDDGGETWRKVHGGASSGGIQRDWTQGGTIPNHLRIHPKTGAAYIGGGAGLFRSDDRGKTFTSLYDEPVEGVDITRDGTLYVSGARKVQVSRDGGKTFTPLACRGLETFGKSVQNIRVSPADPRRMLAWVAGDNWKWVRSISHDGGANWKPITLDNTLATLPFNVRQGYFHWHPTNPNIVWGIGGDWATQSTDGGLTFHWKNNGNNGIMTGGLFNFSVHAPKTVFLAFQDYNGAFTTDGGATWNYRDVSGKGWGGQCYGGFAVDNSVMWYGDAEGWGSPRTLRMTRDGGATWAFPTGADGKPCVWEGADVSFSDPKAERILFASNWRSPDQGATWSRMADCEGVFTADPKTGALYGKKENAVVRSTDHGETWSVVAEVPGGFRDVAVDGERSILYVASEERLKRFAEGHWTTLEVPKDQYGAARVQTVACDPKDPRILYEGGTRDIYASHATICRSTDGGKTWRNLIVTAPLHPGAPDGPKEVGVVRVHPVTREAWVAGQCYGMWRIAPPAPGETGVSAEAASAPKALLPPNGDAMIVSP